MEIEWIKNLADAKLVGGRLVPQHQVKKDEKEGLALEVGLAELADEVSRVVSLFNDYRGANDKISIADLLRRDEDGETSSGFLLIAKGCQLCIERKENRIEVVFKGRHRFQISQYHRGDIRPKIDLFGGVSWVNHEGGNELSIPRLAKLLLLDFCSELEAFRTQACR